MPHLIKIDFESFFRTHFAIPFTVFMVVFIGLELTSLDYKISENFFNTTLHQWAYKDNLFTKTIIHKGGHIFFKTINGLILLTLLVSLPKKSFLHSYSKPLLFLFIAGISGPIIIALLKNHTFIYCPWDLKLFGGEQPYVRLFDYAPAGLKVGHCFPAGHASEGFSFLSLYFFLMIVKPHYKELGLYSGLLLGLIYGISQQMRGAQFLSHDIFSLAVCWLASLVWFLVIFRKNLLWI